MHKRRHVVLIFFLLLLIFAALMVAATFTEAPVAPLGSTSLEPDPADQPNYAR